MSVQPTQLSKKKEKSNKHIDTNEGTNGIWQIVNQMILLTQLAPFIFNANGNANARPCFVDIHRKH